MSFITDWYPGFEITVYPGPDSGPTPYNHVWPANPWEDDLSSFSEKPVIIHAAVISTSVFPHWEVWNTYSYMGPEMVECCWHHALHGSRMQDITVFSVGQEPGLCATPLARHPGGGGGGPCGLSVDWQTNWLLFTTYQADASVAVAQWTFDLQDIVEFDSWREVGGWKIENEVTWPAGADSWEWEGQGRAHINNDNGPYAELLEVVLDPSTLHGTPDEWGGNSSIDHQEVLGGSSSTSDVPWTANYGLVMANMGGYALDPLDAESVIGSPDFYLSDFQEYCTSALTLGSALVPGGSGDLSGLTPPGLLTIDQATLMGRAPVVQYSQNPIDLYPAPLSWQTWLNLMIYPDMLLSGVHPTVPTGVGDPDDLFYNVASRMCNFPGDLWGAYTIKTPRFRFRSSERSLTVEPRSNDAEFWPS